MCCWVSLHSHFRPEAAHLSVEALGGAWQSAADQRHGDICQEFVRVGGSVVGSRSTLSSFLMFFARLLSEPGAAPPNLI